MKKLFVMLLLAAFSLSTFAGMPPQQDTTKKEQKKKMKPKSLYRTTEKAFPKKASTKYSTCFTGQLLKMKAMASDFISLRKR